jgi:hypothetical protein
MNINIILLLWSLVFILQCSSDSPSQADAKPIKSQAWTDLLQKYVDDQGNVDYDGFLKDSLKLDAYLELLTSNAPDEKTWSKEQQIAYWINAYNAFTVKLILNYYPVESIKDIGSTIQIPFVNTPWDIKFIIINGVKLDLNNIEHSILRKKFNEPRIHFAINCASFSCPKLRREAYTAEKLESQLQEQAVEFINDPKRNFITEDKARVSKIFSWFKGDFTKNGSLKDFLNQYAITKIGEETKIRYQDYNWSLNEK